MVDKFNNWSFSSSLSVIVSRKIRDIKRRSWTIASLDCPFIFLYVFTKFSNLQSIKIFVQVAAKTVPKTSLVAECSQFYMLSLLELRGKETILSAVRDEENLVLVHVQR